MVDIPSSYVYSFSFYYGTLSLSYTITVENKYPRGRVFLHILTLSFLPCTLCHLDGHLETCKKCYIKFPACLFIEKDGKTHCSLYLTLF